MNDLCEKCLEKEKKITCGRCGALNIQGHCLECELRDENKELKEILLEVGAMTHKSEKLYKWYCENKNE